MTKNLYALVLLYLVNGCLPVCSQDSSRLQDVRVEIHGQMEITLAGYVVTLQNITHSEQIYYPQSELSGSFTFRGVPSGDYFIVIADGTGAELQREMTQVTSASYINIHIPERNTPRPGAGPVSLKQLRNPPSRNAVEQFTAAQRFSESGEPEKAAAALERAIRLSPDYAEAYTNLAAQHIKLRQYEHAIQESNHAMEIGSPNPMDLSNRALAQWALGFPDDAVQSAEQALRLDRSTPQAHFILGSLLIGDPATRQEGIRHLERVADKFPAAARILARTKAGQR